LLVLHPLVINSDLESTEDRIKKRRLMWNVEKTKIKNSCSNEEAICERCKSELHYQVLS
ncbi:mCG144924, partial [Mus musculus]